MTLKRPTMKKASGRRGAATTPFRRYSPEVARNRCQRKIPFNLPPPSNLYSSPLFSRPRPPPFSPTDGFIADVFMFALSAVMLGSTGIGIKIEYAIRFEFGSVTFHLSLLLVA